MNENLADAISVRNPKNRSIKNVRGIVGTKASKHRSFVRENLVTGRGRGGSRPWETSVQCVGGGCETNISISSCQRRRERGRRMLYLPNQSIWRRLVYRWEGKVETRRRPTSSPGWYSPLLFSPPTPEKKRWLRLVANISLHIHPRVTYIKYISSRTHVFVSALHSPYVSYHVPKE